MICLFVYSIVFRSQVSVKVDRETRQLMYEPAEQFNNNRSLNPLILLTIVSSEKSSIPTIIKNLPRPTREVLLSRTDTETKVILKNSLWEKQRHGSSSRRNHRRVRGAYVKVRAV